MTTGDQLAAGVENPALSPSRTVGRPGVPPHSPAAPQDSTTGGGPEPSRALLGGGVAALAPISDDQAHEFAARFTADFLFWDEDAPQVRYQVLAGYFTDPAAAVLGWNGRGRQHVDLVIPGSVIRLTPQHAVVETSARVVLHERIGEPSRPDRTRNELGVAPPGLQWATASAPGRGSWRAMVMAWTTLHVPVVRGVDGALKVQPRSPARSARPGVSPS